METVDWKTPAGLMALMGLPRVGSATALAVASAGRDPAELLESSRLAELYNTALQLFDALNADGVTVLGFFDERFPDRLREAPSPPAVIYVRGSLDAFKGAALAVVGTRQPSSFGTSATQRLTLAAAQRGIVIVSGLALGIDTLAHQAALAAGARTIAVLGSGIDKITPRQNAGLAERIVDASGALLSEQPPGSPPSPRTLVARNRLQAAVSDGLLVGQSGVKGGTMHTVRFAAEQGRRVWCPVPHARSDKSEGLRALLETPASRLPAVLPAWREHHSLAARLGDAPLARPVTADTVDAWVAEISRPALTAASGGQMSLDSQP